MWKRWNVITALPHWWYPHYNCIVHLRRNRPLGMLLRSLSHKYPGTPCKHILNNHHPFSTSRTFWILLFSLYICIYYTLICIDWCTSAGRPEFVIWGTKLLKQLTKQPATWPGTFCACLLIWSCKKDLSVHTQDLWAKEISSKELAIQWDTAGVWCVLES